MVRAYLREQLGDNLAATHAALLDAAARHYSLSTADDGLRAWWQLPASADYLWHHLTSHLIGAGRRAERNALLADLRWFAAKARQVGVVDVDADLALGDPAAVEPMRRAIRLEGHLLGPVTPAHSHDVVIAARLGADPHLAMSVQRFRATLPHHVTRLETMWALPDLPDPAARRVLTGHTRDVLPIPELSRSSAHSAGGLGGFLSEAMSGWREAQSAAEMSEERGRPRRGRSGSEPHGRGSRALSAFSLDSLHIL